MAVRRRTRSQQRGGGGTGGELQATVSPVGSIETVNILNSGYGYTSNPRVILSHPQIFKKADYVIILDINVFMRYIHVIKRYFERRKSKNPDDIKITLKILNWTRKYTHGHLPDHKRLIKLHKKEFIILKNKKQMNSFIETLKPSR